MSRVDNDHHQLADVISHFLRWSVFLYIHIFFAVCWASHCSHCCGQFSAVSVHWLTVETIIYWHRAAAAAAVTFCWHTAHLLLVSLLVWPSSASLTHSVRLITKVAVGIDGQQQKQQQQLLISTLVAVVVVLWPTIKCVCSPHQLLFFFSSQFSFSVSHFSAWTALGAGLWLLLCWRYLTRSLTHFCPFALPLHATTAAAAATLSLPLFFLSSLFCPTSGN